MVVKENFINIDQIKDYLWQNTTTILSKFAVILS